MCLHPFASAVSHGADRSVTELWHGRSGCHGVLLVFPQPTATAAAAAARGSAARERGQQSFAEARVHEAVDYGVDAGRGVAQQVDESDGRPWEGPFGGDVVESPPGVGNVQRHPAEKEQDNDDHQHADDPLLGLQLGLGRVAARPLRLDGPTGRSRGGHLHRMWPRDDVDVATVSVVAAAGHGGGESILHICGSKVTVTLSN